MNFCKNHQIREQVLAGKVYNLLGIGWNDMNVLLIQRNQPKPSNCNKLFRPTSDESYSLDENIENRCKQNLQMATAMHVWKIG